MVHIPGTCSWCGKQPWWPERQSDEIAGLRRTLWLIINNNGGYTLEHTDLENWPGPDAAWLETVTDENTGAVQFCAREKTKSV
jgi:hypothetical protein